MVLTIILAIVVFTIVVLVHELGHYWAAKKAGIHVVEFSIGIGPRLFHFKRGDTIFSLKLFPLGGSCRMLGDGESDDGVDEEGDIIEKSPNPRSFNAKPVWARMIVILAGALLNFVLAILLSMVMTMFNSQQEATVRDFSQTSPMREAGILEGDRIVRMDGRRIRVQGDMRLGLLDVDGSPINLTVDRDGQRLDFTVIPHYHQYEVDGEQRSRWMLGFYWGIAVGTFEQIPASLQNQPAVRQLGFLESVAMGYQNVTFLMRATVTGIIRLFTHGFNIADLMGPIGIVDMVGGHVEGATMAAEEAEASVGMAVFWTMMNFTILLSANLGIFNLLPLPALDGGRMVFLTLEAIRRKPIPPEREGMVHFIGFALIMVLAVVIAYNDILRFF
ncbi:MAG: site-2 protease family protein [Defluviitaleaceae bacterium]|nr:site-2 protease family protein [Defluviitaleaceae bacterium]